MRVKIKSDSFSKRRVILVKNTLYQIILSQESHCHEYWIDVPPESIAKFNSEYYVVYYGRAYIPHFLKPKAVDYGEIQLVVGR